MSGRSGKNNVTLLTMEHCVSFTWKESPLRGNICVLRESYNALQCVNNRRESLQRKWWRDLCVNNWELSTWIIGNYSHLNKCLRPTGKTWRRWNRIFPQWPNLCWNYHHNHHDHDLDQQIWITCGTICLESPVDSFHLPHTKSDWMGVMMVMRMMLASMGRMIVVVMLMIMMTVDSFHLPHAKSNCKKH